MDPVRHRAGPTITGSSRWSTRSPACPADLRQRPGGLHRPGQQRHVRDPDRQRRRLPGIDRNGNLQITQFYYGAAQPSNLAAQIAGALFYGSAQDNGGPVSDPNILAQRQHHLGRPRRRRRRRGHRPAGRRHGLPVLLALLFGAARPRHVDFFQVHRPWPERRGDPSAGPSACSRPATACPRPTRSGRIAGSPTSRSTRSTATSIMISSNTGRIFATENAGRDLVRDRRPAVFGTPAPSAWPWPTVPPTRTPPTASATSTTSSTSAPQTGQIYVTQDGGGSAHQQRLDRTSPPASTARPSSRSSPTPPAAATRPTPSPGPASTTSPTRSPRRPTRTPTWVNITGTGRTASTTWPTRSSARPTTR